MKYRVLLRPSAGGGFDAWVPNLDGCAARGRTEEEAIEFLRHAIEGRMDLAYEPGHAVGERTLEVDTPRQAAPNPKIEEDLPGPTPLGAWPQIMVGGTILVLGLIGFAFFFAFESASPFFLFAPVLVAALGTLGFLFGLMTLGNKPSQPGSSV